MVNYFKPLPISVTLGYTYTGTTDTLKKLSTYKETYQTIALVKPCPVNKYITFRNKTEQQS